LTTRTADEEFGQNPGLRDYLEEAEIAYVMAVPKNTEFTNSSGQHVVNIQPFRGCGEAASSGLARRCPGRFGS
jgi:hypothetical protein